MKRRLALMLSVPLSLAGCAGSYLMSDDRADNDDMDFGDTGAAGAPGWDGVADTASEVDDGFIPPEESGDRLAFQPALTDTYVFIAAPDRGTVIRVNVQTLEVRTLRVGGRPTLVRTLPDQRRAVVLNEGDSSVTVIEGDALTGTKVSMRPNMNRMELAPGGRWSVSWYDPRSATGSTGGSSVSFNEMTLVDLDEARAVAVVPGFSPKAVTFSQDGKLCLVVSDARLALFDLTESEPEPVVVEMADPLSAPAAEEVLLSPDGLRAFVRQRGRSVLTVVDLVLREVEEIPVPDEPTDMEITPDGLELVVVSRGDRSVTVFDVDDPHAAPRVVPFPDDAPLGRVDIGADGLALLYTTVSDTSRYATWSIEQDFMTARPLIKPVVSMSRSGDGAVLLAVHPSADAGDGSTPEPYQGRHAFSLINLQDFRSNVVAVPAEVTAFSHSPEGRFGYLQLAGRRVVQVMDYRRLLADELTLPSVPSFIGVLPPGSASSGPPSAWMSQEHPLGRLSFYQPEDRRLRTLTGFELNSQIEE